MPATRGNSKRRVLQRIQEQRNRTLLNFNRRQGRTRHAFRVENCSTVNQEPNIIPNDQRDEIISSLELTSIHATITNCNSSDSASSGNISDSASAAEGIQEGLVNWYKDYNVNLQQLTALLKLLNKFEIPEFKELPHDARSLFKVKETAEEIECAPGKLIHKSLTEQLLHRSSELSHLPIIKLCVNVDGIPIHKSTTK